MVGAGAGQLTALGEVVAEGECRHRGIGLPRGAEPDSPVIPGGEGPGLVGSLEGAVSVASEQNILAESEHGQIDVLVAVDIERVGPGHPGEIAGRPVQQLPETKVAPDLAVVAIEPARVLTPRQIQVRATVLVTVEHRYTATDEVLELAVVDVVDT